jgi:hypothetical protein
MGMRIQGGSYNSAEQMQWQQRRQNFDALTQAISSGNLSDAKDALAKIQGQGTGSTINPDSFLGKIASALQSDDISSAQQLLASRQSQNGSTASTQATGAADGASAAGSTSGVSGRHHHRHGGGGSAQVLSQAIQSGDVSKAQSTMKTIISELQQLASLANTTGSGSSSSPYGSLASSAASAAQKLMDDPNFKALEDAVSKGDAAGMKTAWAKLMSGASGDASASTTSTATAQTQVAA